MPSPTTITPSQLNRLIGTPDAPVIIDVRIDEDFDADPRLIPTAIRHAHSSIDEIAQSLTGSRVVVSCHKGKKLSEGSAAVLRTFGVQAEVLAGGHLGWAAQTGVSLVKPIATPSRWVTRHRPKIDRIACPWLIRRFIDRDAQFLFVSPSEVEDVAEKFDATPFDIQGVHYSHRAEACTFDTMLEEFGLSSPPLSRLATIIRGADTNRHDLAPECAGLMAASLGLSRMYRDDLAQLEAGIALYDAFYRWARDATDETHDWAPEAKG